MAKRRKQPTRTLSPWQAKAWEWRWPIAVGLVLAVATALRFHSIGAASIWLDEAYSIDWSSQDYGFLVEIARIRDFHPPEYYMLLHNWMLAFGRSEAAVRGLSAVAGVAAVGGTYLLGRDLFSRRAGLNAAILLSVSSFALYYAQETRSYSLLLALAVFSMHAYWRLYAGRTRGALAYYVLATAALAYVHNSGLFVIVAQGLHRAVAFAMEWSRARSVAPLKGDLVRWGLAFGGVGLLYLPWLGGLLGQLDRLNAGYWMPKPAFGLDSGVGPDFTVVGTFARFTGPALAAWLLWAFVANGLARSRLGGLNRERNPDDTDRRDYPAAKVLLLVAWLLSSVFIPFIEASVAQPAFISRALIPALAPFLLLAGAGIGRLKAVPLQAAAVAALVAIATPGLLTYYDEPAKEPWRDVTAYVEANSGADTAVVINGPNVFLAYNYYARNPAIPVHRTGDTSAAGLAEAANATRGHASAWLLLSHSSGDTDKLAQAMDAAFREGNGSAAQPQCQVFAATGAQLANNPIYVLHWGPPAPAEPGRDCQK
ncbi:MAG: glycosyltransferase family 39 protein [Thermoplasmatota archaeon]